jgi:hypothetical protein
MPDWETTFPPPGAPVRMRVVDIATYKHPAVGAKAANKVLKQLRAQNTWLEDITEAPLLNWRSFLASRSDASSIIGVGVLTFLFVRFPGTVDANWSNTPRADFVLIRCDRSAVRLHPASTGEQPQPIFGKPGRGLLDWVQGPADNPPPEPVPSRPAARWNTVMTKQQCLSVPRVDCISRRRAKTILNELAEYMAWHSILKLDLTDGTQFPWWRWLANLPDQAVDMLFGDNGIRAFWAAQDAQGTHYVYVVVQVDGTAFSLDILQERTSIKELDSQKSPCFQEHPAAGDVEQGEPVGHSRGGQGEPTADPSRSSSTGRSSPPTPAGHSDSTVEERVTNTGSPPLDSHGGVGGHGVESPMRPTQSPTESVTMPRPPGPSRASTPLGPALPQEQQEVRPPVLEELPHAVPPPPPRGPLAQPELPGWTPGGEPMEGSASTIAAWPPGLPCPAGNPRPLAQPQGPQQESHQQQWQPQGGNSSASSEAPEFQTQVHQQPAHRSNAHSLAAQPDPQGDLPSHQTRQETQRGDQWQQQDETQPQQQRRWQENRWWERGWDDGHNNREGNGANLAWRSAGEQTHRDQAWYTGHW